jgi:hypothetical protein
MDIRPREIQKRAIVNISTNENLLCLLAQKLAT